MTITLFAILATWVFYMSFAACICAYRQYIRGKLNKLNLVLFAPILISFCLIDMAINWSLLLLVCGYPPEKTFTISDRFEYYRNVKAPSEFSKKLANFICEQLLNTIDPSDHHC